ncbi:MAG: NADH-quinone oxidoreductase subunit J [Ignavibacteriae bacterium]|nr:NADH-quinone oxidoreductase subunit J [Ignavibacteriota bacterium]
MADILFYVFAAITVCSAMVVAFARNVIYAAFALLFTFLGVAGLYVFLQADFLAVAQVMVYIGGILILIIFGVMLTNRVTNVDVTSGTLHTLPATIIAGVLLGTLVLLVTRATWIDAGVLPDVQGTTAAIGERLMSTYLLPFEIIGILLLVTIMGAAMIARADSSKKESA